VSEPETVEHAEHRDEAFEAKLAFGVRRLELRRSREAWRVSPDCVLSHLVLTAQGLRVGVASVDRSV